MSRPLWQVGLIKKAFPTPLTASLTRLPFLGRLVDYLLFDQDEIVYLPINESVSADENVALPSAVVRYFVKKASHRWIMNECICRSASQCRHYPIDIGCLFLGEAATRINPQLGRPATIEEALAFVDRCQKEGLVHLIGRNKLDSVWLNVKPGNRLLTICNCCECCCLWKILLPNAHRAIADSVQRLEGINVEVTGDCQGCGSCLDTCFVNAISLADDKAIISDNCRGCGRCVETCPEEAIKLELQNVDGLNRALIDRISSLVDVT